MDNQQYTVGKANQRMAIIELMRNSEALGEYAYFILI
jgi:hypothetical protein